MSPPAPTNLLYASSKYVLSLKSGTKKNAPKHKRRKAININIKTYFSLSLSPDLWTGIGWKFLLWWVGRIAIFEELYAAIMGNAADTRCPRTSGISQLSCEIARLYLWVIYIMASLVWLGLDLAQIRIKSFPWLFHGVFIESVMPSIRDGSLVFGGGSGGRGRRVGQSLNKLSASKNCLKIKQVLFTIIICFGC